MRDAFHPGLAETVGCLCPRRQGLKQVNGTGQNNGRDPPQRREARFANGVAYIPAVFAGMPSAGHGATEAGDRNGRCKPGFHASDRSDSPKPRQRVRRRLAGAPAAACRSRA
nr:hypothetical protein [Escherichia coli]